MAAKRDSRSFVYVIRIPILVALSWAVLAIVAGSLGSPFTGVVLLTVHIVLVGVAGFLTTRRGQFGLWHAALAGALVMLAEQVVVNCVAFIVAGQFTLAAEVVVSYAMTVWVAAVVAVLGGLAGKAVARANAAI